MVEIYAAFGALLAFEIIFPGMLLVWSYLSPATVNRARLRLDRTPWRCFWVGLPVSIILLGIVFILVAMLPVELTQILSSLLFFITIAFSSIGAAGLSSKLAARFMLHSNMENHPIIQSPGRYFWLELGVGLWIGVTVTVILLPAITVALGLSISLAWAIGWSLFMIIITIAVFLLIRSTRKGHQVVSNDYPSLLRRAIMLELFAGFPLIGWFIALPIMFVLSVGSAIFAVFCRGSRQQRVLRESIDH